MLLIIANIGTAVVIVPIMWRRYKELSIGYVTARLVECTFILVGVISVVAVVTLRNQSAGANEGRSPTRSRRSSTGRSCSARVGASAGERPDPRYTTYRSQLVPRPWPWLAMIGVPPLILTGTAILLGGNHPSSTLHALQGVATIPEALWELFLGVYCTIWGFRKDAPSCPRR